MNEFLNGDEVEYDFVTRNIPCVMQALYTGHVIETVSLTEIRDAFRINQMQGKAWLLNHIKSIDKNSKVLVIGSWLGFTSYCLYKMGFTNITETDPDSRLLSLANHLNVSNKQFKHLSKDVNELDLSSYNLIINTSCEHIGNNSWFDNIPIGCRVALHSTNLKWHDHVNTVETVDEMKMKYPLNLDYAGELKFNHIYSRYMLVGTKI